MLRLAVLGNVRLPGVFLLVAALVAPVAAAQGPDAPSGVNPTLYGYLADPGHELAPGANETVGLQITYTWGKASVPGFQQDSNDITNSNTQPTNITLAPGKVPTWVANVTFEPPFVLANYSSSSSQGAPAPGQQVTLNVNVILHMRRDAPARDHENLTVKLHADANGATPATDYETEGLMLRPSDSPAVTLEPKGSNVTVVKGGRATPITFYLHNVGNDQTTVQLNVSTRPQDSIVDFPAVVTLDVGQTLPVDVLLQVPWTYGEVGSLELQATPISNETNGKVVKASVDVNGLSAAPGIEPLLLVACIGLLALARRRR